MTKTQHDAMNLDELRRYVLTHREDVAAFHTYIDRSKAEGHMISLDLSDNQWEEKIKEAIRYSSDAIRWSPTNKEDSDVKLSIITNWWKNLAHKTVIKHHITGVEIDRLSGIWEPIQIKPPSQVVVLEPSLITGEFTAWLEYKDQNSLTHQIETVAIDLDLTKQDLFIWPFTSEEVFIFSVMSE